MYKSLGIIFNFILYLFIEILNSLKYILNIRKNTYILKTNQSPDSFSNINASNMCNKVNVINA